MKRYRLFIISALIVIIAIQFSFFSQISLASPKAPEPVISQWINQDPGTLMNMRGKVIVIDFFQMWCPGCNNFSVPLMFQLEEKYKQRNDIVFLSIHTVFEGHSYQTPDDLKHYVEEKGITHPVGIDEYGHDSYVPITMKKYRTGGTPCITIIDKKGYIRLQKLGGFRPNIAVKLIDQLLEE